MIHLQGCACSFGPRVLFEGVDWTIGPGDRMALVGPNGAGKTTLLRLTIGELTPDRGTRVMAKGSRIGYLPQEAAERFEGTVLERALEARRDVQRLREELDALHQKLSESGPDDPDLARTLDRAGELQHRLEHLAEHAIEPEARAILSGLGFATADQERALSEFSGGWRMRAALAALLLSDPTVLLLDEPTNHLDLPAMEWLEDYLEDFLGGLVVVSHDRVFLDRVATEICELEGGRWTIYPSSSFTRYLEEKERREEQLESHNQQLDRKIAQLNRFVERFGAKNTKATQAQSKRKMISRLEAERVVIPRRAKTVRFHFPAPPHAGRSLLELKGAAFSYGLGDVFRDADVRIERGEKVAIVGANGAGKTTLLRVLAGQLDPRLGTRDVPPLTRAAYFAQHAAETLDPDATVLESLERQATAEWRPRLRSHLGQFLMSGDDVFKRCRVLSGGERQRVALALILLSPANLLLLDEPTHHLDLASKEVLEEALVQYPGGVVVVTHDRSLMVRVATRVIEIRDGRVIPYPGGYADYEAARLMRGAEASAKTEVAAPKSPARRPQPAPRKPSPGKRDAGRRERDVKRLEAEIMQRESRIHELEASLADPEIYRDGARARELLAEYERLRSENESLWQRLEDL
ncbi:MAG TPA: ABC-F family ATP-binding cassette domain-containing protein [Candidatus Eisenbacteria bacterium]|nr:ABC-F family ATP-binding cassette domain-containing protein [Candidatus Eisenbacteria bacterium]